MFLPGACVLGSGKMRQLLTLAPRSIGLRRFVLGLYLTPWSRDLSVLRRCSQLYTNGYNSESNLDFIHYRGTLVPGELLSPWCKQGLIVQTCARSRLRSSRARTSFSSFLRFFFRLRPTPPPKCHYLSFFSRPSLDPRTHPQ